MSKKRTLADLMDNDFFIDFDTTTPKAKVVRKNLNESLKRRRTLTESKLKEGFYDYEYDLSKDKISEKDLYKALVTGGELVALNAGNTGEAVSFKDGGVYCDTTYEVTEYDGKFSVTEFYNSDDGESKEGDYYFETDSFETLCAELQRIFPNALIECKMTEEVEEPDNAVVDCKVNKVIAHCEDEKPVDCLGEKKPLEKPLTEEPNKMTADELKDKYGTDDVDIINAGREEQDRVELKEARSDVDTVRIMAWCCHNCVAFFEAVANNAAKTKQRKLNKEAYKAMQAKFGLATAEAEEIMSKGYALWKNLYYKK